VLVERSLYDDFVARFAEAAAKIKQGDPLEADTQIGSLISLAHREKVHGFVDRGKAGGAEVVLGGALEAGNFIAPTVFADVPHDSSLAREEIFGPVLSISRFKDEAEAMQKANDSVYGLGAYVHTQNLARAHRLARGLKAGAVSVISGVPMAPNTPFGGYKQSGFGRELSVDALDAYLETKGVLVNTGNRPINPFGL
jgi:acyl-CoA reductase-like NAD-dependent aldehyde dehydrogenase